MASKIQIKRSTGSTAPAADSLYPGELAYTEGLETIYLGSAAYKTITAGGFVVGTTYTIVTVGDTTQAQWVTAGVPTETTAEVGTVFTAAAIGTGTGTAGAHNIADQEYIVAGKAYTDMLVPETTDGPASIILKEDTDNAGEHGVTLTVPASLTGDVTLTLPGAAAAADNMLLTSTDDGVLSWDNTLDVVSVTTSGAINVDDATGSTTVATGALIVDGGVGIVENVFAGGTINAAGAINAAGQVNANAITQSTTVATGALVVDGGLGIAKNTFVGGTLNSAGALVAAAAVTVGTTLGVTGLTTVAGLTASGDVSIAGNLEVTGETTSIETADVVVKDKTMVLGVAGGMEEQTYTQTLFVVTVTSIGHTFLNNQYVYISGAVNQTSIPDGVYQVTKDGDDAFTFVAGVSETVTSNPIFHSSDDVTDTTGTGSGVVVPNGSATMASIIYNGTSNDWDVSENIDLASGKGIKIATTEILSAATALPVAYGGTGLSAAAQGSVLVTNTANTISALDGGGLVDGVLIYTKSTDTIGWTQIELSSGEVTGTLPVSKGGTGSTSLTDGGVLLGGGLSGVVTALDAGFTGTNTGYNDGGTQDTTVTGVGNIDGTGFTASVTVSGGVIQSITAGFTGGTGFIVDEEITLTGNASGTATAKITVATITSGAIKSTAVLTAGQMLVGDGTTDPSIESGGTLRTSIGVAIGSDVQAWDTQLDDIAGLAVTDNNIMVGDGSNWTLETPSAARTSLGLAIDSDVQAYSTALQSISGLTEIAGSVIYTTADNAYAALAAGTAGQVLASNGAAAPAWSDIDGGSY